MEFSILEILGLLQKADGISRLLGKIEISDFITYGTLIFLLYYYLSKGSKNLNDSIDKKNNELKLNIETKFNDLKQDFGSLKDDNDKKNSELKADIKSLKDDNNKKFADLKQDFNSLKNDNKGEISSIKNDIKNIENRVLTIEKEQILLTKNKRK